MHSNFETELEESKHDYLKLAKYLMFPLKITANLLHF
jgi:hypothetical protein